MIEKILNLLFKRRDIVNCDRDLYLSRWFVVRKESFAIFIHKFVRSDEDRALHDHPWNFLVIPLWRGYIEHSEQVLPCMSGYSDPCHEVSIPRKRRVLPILGTRFRQGTYRHRVELLTDSSRCTCGHPTSSHTAGSDGRIECDDWFECECEQWQPAPRPSWSLFIRFKRWRDWGFWMPEGFIQWQKFWQEKCE